MGTISKRPLEDFGLNLKEKVEGVRHSVGGRLDELGKQAQVKSRKEGQLTRKLERITAMLPSTTWLALAGVSIAGAFGLRIAGKNHTAILVGQLAPSFLLAGIYNKLVKISGSDRSRI
jgi:hypothetical protein